VRRPSRFWLATKRYGLSPDKSNLRATLLKGLSKKEQESLEGSGKTMKHIKVYCLKEIDEKKIIMLLKLVKEK